MRITIKREDFYFVMFFIIFLLIYFSLHFYIYKRICSGLKLSWTYKIFLKISFIILGILFILSQILIRKYNVKILLYIGSIWLGILSISLTLFILKDIIQLILPSKSYILTLGSIILTILLSIIAILNDLSNPVLKEIRIRFPGLNSELKNFTIIHLSDLHLSPISSVRKLNYIVSEINKHNPDVVFITGDLIDMDICKWYKNYCYILRGLKTRYGIYAVTGNHEFYAGINNFLKIAELANIRVLRNEKIKINKGITIIGLDDDTAKQYGLEIKSLDKIIGKDIRESFIILLLHKPVGFEKAVELGVNLQLSGHIHSGQLPPINFLAKIFFKYFYGLYRYKDSFIYVSSGSGTWGPPMRLFSKKEIVKIILE